jgi:hypothetical protein
MQTLHTSADDGGFIPPTPTPLAHAYAGVDTCRLLIIDPAWLPLGAERLALDYVDRGLAVLVHTTGGDGFYPVTETPEGGIHIGPKWTDCPLSLSEGGAVSERFTVTADDGRFDVLTVTGTAPEGKSRPLPHLTELLEDEGGRF